MRYLTVLYKSKLLYGAYPLYIGGVLSKDLISLKYRVAAKKALGIALTISDKEFHDILFDVDLGDLVEVWAPCFSNEDYDRDLARRKTVKLYNKQHGLKIRNY